MHTRSIALSPTTLSTLYIKYGLEKIRQTQMQVLTELKKYQYLLSAQYTRSLRVVNDDIQYPKDNMNQLKSVDAAKRRYTNSNTDYKMMKDDAEVNTYGNLINNNTGQTLDNQSRKRLAMWVSETDKTELRHNIDHLGNKQRQYDIIERQYQLKKQLEDVKKERDNLVTDVNSLKIRANYLAVYNRYLRDKLVLYTQYKNIKVEPEHPFSLQSKNIPSIPQDLLIESIYRIAQEHNRMYNTLKKKGKLSLYDLDSEETIQYTFTKVLEILQGAEQRYKGLNYNIIEGSIVDEVLEDNDDEDAENHSRYRHKAWYNDGTRHNTKAKNYGLASKNGIVKSIESRYEPSKLTNELAELRRENLDLKEKLSAATKIVKYMYSRHASYLLFRKTLYVYIQTLRSENDDLRTRQLSFYHDTAEQQVEYKRIIYTLQTHMQQIKRYKVNMAGLIKSINSHIITPNDDGSLQILRKQLEEVIYANITLRKDKYALKMANYRHLVFEGEWQIYRDHLIEQLKLKYGYLANLEKDKMTLLYAIHKLKEYINNQTSTYQKSACKISELYYVIAQTAHKHEEVLESKVEYLMALRTDSEKRMILEMEIKELTFKYRKLLGEYKQCRRELIQCNGTIDHLWKIKEMEYGNIHNMLAQMK